MIYTWLQPGQPEVVGTGGAASLDATGEGMVKLGEERKAAMVSG